MKTPIKFSLRPALLFAIGYLVALMLSIFICIAVFKYYDAGHTAPGKPSTIMIVKAD